MYLYLLVHCICTSHCICTPYCTCTFSQGRRSSIARGDVTMHLLAEDIGLPGSLPMLHNMIANLSQPQVVFSFVQESMHGNVHVSVCVCVHNTSPHSQTQEAPMNALASVGRTDSSNPHTAGLSAAGGTTNLLATHTVAPGGLLHGGPSTEAHLVSPSAQNQQHSVGGHHDLTMASAAGIGGGSPLLLGMREGVGGTGCCWCGCIRRTGERGLWVHMVGEPVMH